jgi:hypothetical protein
MNAPAQARIPIQLFDNFAPDALQVREAVIAGGFHDEQGPDGALYTGISGYPVPHWYERIAELIGQPIVPKLSCFRLNLAGELPHSFVHSDDICAKYASVLYLNKPEQCKGGTAFWSHPEWGDHLFSDEELRARGLEYAAYHQMMTRKWKNLAAVAADEVRAHEVQSLHHLPDQVLPQPLFRSKHSAKTGTTGG